MLIDERAVCRWNVRLGIVTVQSRRCQERHIYISLISREGSRRVVLSKVQVRERFIKVMAIKAWCRIVAQVLLVEVAPISSLRTKMLCRL